MKDEVFQVIKDFNLQLSYKPTVQNAKKLFKSKKVIVVGMGGSHLAADLLKIIYPDKIEIHNNYGLPQQLKADLKNSLLIFSSYSGNTEEVLDSFQKAQKAQLKTAVVGTDGKLMAWAERQGIPFIRFPQAVQPRFAVGYSLLSFLKLLNKVKELQTVNRLAGKINPLVFKKQGQKLAGWLQGYIPVIYASQTNKGLAVNWKIKFNETAKQTAFYGVLPEVNHNEIAAPSSCCFYLFFKDEKDMAAIKKRMDIMAKIYKEQKMKTYILPLTGKNIWEKIFHSLILADWTSYYLALKNKQNPQNIAIIELFKKKMASS